MFRQVWHFRLWLNKNLRRLAFFVTIFLFIWSFWPRDLTLPLNTGGSVILLAYQRSGSSFVGQLLASNGETFYVYEPLYRWRAVLGPDVNLELAKDFSLALGDLLDCNPNIMTEWKRKPFWYFREKPKGHQDSCKGARVRILKTIRARASFMEDWLAERADVKVIHLIRDPRGIYSSVVRGGALWTSKNRNVSLICNYMKKDSSLSAILGPQRYFRLKYEDMATNPTQLSQKLFAFMNAAMNEDVFNYIKKHTGIGGSHPEKSMYLNTFRDDTFDPNHWKKSLTGREIRHTEEECREVMDEFGYALS